MKELGDQFDNIFPKTNFILFFSLNIFSSFGQIYRRIADLIGAAPACDMFGVFGLVQQTAGNCEQAQ